MKSNAASQPIDDSERAEVLDALRGFALLGIFLSHVPDFSGYSFLSADQRASLDHFALDGALAAVQEFLIRGKFFSLFSLLFGIGFAVQLESAARRHADFTRHFSRRLGVLLVIGLAHASVWYGDILKDYAILGFLLLPTARRTTRTLAWTAAVVALMRTLWPVLVATSFAMFGSGAESRETGTNFASTAHAFASDSLGTIASANLDLARIKAMQIVYDGKALSILSMFLLGALIGRSGIYRDLPRRHAFLRRVFCLTAPIGLLGNAALVPLHSATPAFPPTPQWALEQVLFAIAVPAMTLTYVCGFALLWQTRAIAALRLLTSPGRMALTTYVSQTLIGVGLFYGVGFGLYGRVGLAEGSAAALLLFAIQCAFTGLWLHAFRFGPLEWIWRSCTYGKRVPMLRSVVGRRAALT